MRLLQRDSQETSDLTTEHTEQHRIFRLVSATSVVKKAACPDRTSDRSFVPSVRDIERLSRQFLMRRVRSREDRPV